MISSEIASSGYSALGRLRSLSKSRPQMVNPQLLTACDSISLTSNTALESEKNLAQGGELHHTPIPSQTMLPLGSNRASSFSNGGSQAQLTTRAQVTKFANPPAVEYNGQMWHVR